MRKRWVIPIMFLLFIVEGTIMPWLIPVDWLGRLVPQFTFVFVLYAAFYAGRHTALMLGVSFGLLQDLVYYGHLIGVHTFAMGLCGYLIGLLLAFKRIPMLTLLSIIGMTCLLYDSLIYSMYRVFRITQDTYVIALMNHIMPSLFLQLAFALVFYIPARRWFSGYSQKKPLDDAV
ncbi:rod shape-determining protein MreD [Paenibacillus sp. 1P07SE]|uniref:rod shape-determining protein MreD n=1 Tax=Paenibacillus sp. 1P07SE TaxID=3132209 RepID=UPI0039A6A1EE